MHDQEKAVAEPHQNDTEAAQVPITRENIDALIITIKYLARGLESRVQDRNPYLRGYQRGLIAAYRDVIRMLGEIDS